MVVVDFYRVSRIIATVPAHPASAATAIREGSVMGRISIGTNVFVYPNPVALLGAMVEGKVNFMALGWVSRVNADPPWIGVGVYRGHHTAKGIRETGTFSVNVPSADLMEAVDYCGLVSGSKTDKSGVFECFFGELKTAPLIAACPLCLECRLVQTVELPTNDWFIGEIVSAWAEETCLTGGKPDIRKINPLLLTMPDNRYWTVGPEAGKAWSAGAERVKEQKKSV
jgi:flavin reductase (DIM6/NTAB) family NADH-FMN oxidoreductase RutF